jgi:hypothetical protein
MKLLPNPSYDPETQVPLSSKTKLEKGITIAKFLGSYGDKTSFRHIKYEDVRRQIARNLTLHAKALTIINSNTEIFRNVRVIVSEGIYNRRPIDTKNKTMQAKASGQLVYYQVINADGNIDFEKTFDVAVFWKDNLNFQEMYLDYDEYNPNGNLSAQIGILMPQVPENYEIKDNRFKRSLFTVYNNKIQTKRELIEILEK